MNARVALVLVLSFAGCGGKTTSTGQSISELQNCATHVWVRPDHACQCPEGFLTNTNECTANDCSESNAVYLGPGGKSFDFTLRKTNQARSFSALGGRGGVIHGIWLIKPDRSLAQTFSSGEYATGVQCDEQSLTRPDAATYRRAPAEIEQALISSAASGQWTNIAFGK